MHDAVAAPGRASSALDVVAALAPTANTPLCRHRHFERILRLTRNIEARLKKDSANRETCTHAETHLAVPTHSSDETIRYRSDVFLSARGHRVPVAAIHRMSPAC